MTWFEELNAELGVEFDRYAVEHPAFAAKIPRGAQVVLQLPDQPRFNSWLRRLANKQHQPGQPIVIVHIGKLQRDLGRTERHRPAFARAH